MDIHHSHYTNIIQSICSIHHIICEIRDTSRGVLLLVNQHGIPNFYPKFMKVKNLKVILNELSLNTMSNTIGKYIIITFHIVNKPYPCRPYMFITEIILQSSQLCLFGFLPWNPCWKQYSQKISGYATGDTPTLRVPWSLKPHPFSPMPS